MPAAVLARRDLVRPVPVVDADADAPLIYLAGPFSFPDPAANTHRVLKIADALLDLGVVPVVPHLSLLWQLVSPKPYARWLAYDRKLIDRCDALLRIPGDSAGASDEEEYAATRGLPVLRPRSASIADCIASVRAWHGDSESADELLFGCDDCGRWIVFCRCGGGEG